MATFMLIMLSSAMSTRICAARAAPLSGRRSFFAADACFSCPPDATLPMHPNQFVWDSPLPDH